MLDVRGWIADDSGIGQGGFAGAVFFTYSLNLNFFEQIIAPALDRAGYANVLIITDPDGYTSALDLGARSLTGVGRRYVVAPLRRRGHGIQHAKLLLMAGEQRGRLLIGSGNLTLHGYGRNLELFTCYDTDVQHAGASDLYPFQTAWRLIVALKQNQLLTDTARRQLEVIAERAPWLDGGVLEAPDGSRVWHNYEIAILTQLQDWRNQRLGGHRPLEALYVVAPYYDQDLSTLRQVHSHFSPGSMQVWVDPQATNFDGLRLARVWENADEHLSAFAVHGETKAGTRRTLHAKALIGIEADGAWCLTGSANISRPALQRTWRSGGNLEVVTFHWRPEKNAFDHLLKNPAIAVEPIDVRAIEQTAQDSSEQAQHRHQELVIEEAWCTANQLHLSLARTPASRDAGAYLRFLRSGEEMHLDPAQLIARTIMVELEQPPSGVEAVQIQVGEECSAYRWIEFPAELERYGARAYYQRIKSQIETFDGAEKLFEELLNYLWERVEAPATKDADQTPGHSSRRRSQRDGHNAPPEPPPAEDFVTEEELVERIHWSIDGQVHYDRSLLSLRELLSLVLLRLTTPTQERTDAQESATGEPSQQEEERRVKRIAAQEALRNYVCGYCRRYGQRLVDPAFLERVDPRLLFENHYTLGRVLLELTRKSEVFSRSDLEQCFWRVWAPLVWPEIVGLEGEAALKAMTRFHVESLVQKAWCDAKMPTITVLLVTQALDRPHPAASPQQVKTYLAARKVLRQFYNALGKKAFGLDAQVVEDVWGTPLSQGSMAGESTGLSPERRHQLEGHLKELLNYRTPVETRLEPLRELAEAERARKSKVERAKLEQRAKERGLTDELRQYRQHPRPIESIQEDINYCPKCYVQLPAADLHRLQRGELILCPNCRDRWIYMRPCLPARIA